MTRKHLINEEYTSIGTNKNTQSAEGAKVNLPLFGLCLRKVRTTEELSPLKGWGNRGFRQAFTCIFGGSHASSTSLTYSLCFPVLLQSTVNGYGTRIGLYSPGVLDLLSPHCTSRAYLHICSERVMPQSAMAVSQPKGHFFANKLPNNVCKAQPLSRLEL